MRIAFPRVRWSTLLPAFTLALALGSLTALAGTVDPKANPDDAELDCAGQATDAKATCVAGCSGKGADACRTGCEATFQAARKACEKRRDHMIKTQACQRTFQACIEGASESKKEGCRKAYLECKERK